MMHRRHHQRRRLVLYSVGRDDAASRTPRADEQIRSARRPVARYGNRVRRRLEGRWFSLVPVRRRVLYGVAAAWFVAASILVLAHHLALTWSPIATRPAVATPLRMDAADGFANLLLTATWAATAATCLLIYQLRRYRLDDYRGRYRVWRIAIIAATLVAITSAVDVFAAIATLADSTLGPRVGLSPSRWLRILFETVTAVMTVRLLIETRRCTSAQIAAVTAIIAAVAREYSWWNDAPMTHYGVYLVAVAAPLVAAGCAWLAAGCYLRKLYRDVLEITDYPLVERYRDWRDHRDEQKRLDRSETRSETRNETRNETLDDVRDAAPTADPPTRSRTAKTRRGTTIRPTPSAAAQTDDANADNAESNPNEFDDSESTASASTGKRRWFGLRSARPNNPSADANDDATDDPSTDAPDDSDADDRQPPDVAADTAATGRRWFRRKRTPDPPHEDASVEPATRDDAAAVSDSDDVIQQRDHAPDDVVDDDAIDWDSMSKTERRRMRKQLKRQRAA